MRTELANQAWKSGRIRPGAERVATLTLNVAAVTGTHKLWIAYGGHHPTIDGEAAFMEPGPTFEIRVGAE